jgi:hypothetical protein
LVGYIILSGIVGSVILGSWLRNPLGNLFSYTQRLSVLHSGLVIVTAILLETGTRLI